MTMPKAITKTPDTVVHTHGSTLMRRVVAFSRSVKSNRETMRLAAIRVQAAPCMRLPPTMTGRKGRTHGASTVRTPATRDRSAVRTTISS